jgi:SAM-dependent methyltransferase
MKLYDGSEITTNQIEELNANGPYSMAIWNSGEVSVGNEEGLAGRSEYFLKLIRESILKNFSLKEIENLSILDIGCNDGWVLHQLSDLPFANMVGIEPRLKNIEKGKTVRKILKLKNSVEYRVGDIESIEGEKFDIVICAGVLYHVESIPSSLRKIRESCKKMVFIESRCLSSSHITQEIKDEIEMRDLVYQFKEEICGITAQKYESAYHDGSSAHNTIVNVPSAESLIMNLSILGFDNIDMVADPDTYRSDVWKDKRPLGGVCITAILPEIPIVLESEEDDWITKYERGLEAEILPRDLLEPLYKSFCLNENIEFTGNLIQINKYLTSSDGEVLSIDKNWLPKKYQTKYAIEILKNWKYKPSDKIALEYGKLLKSENQLEEALVVLKRIITQLNADWRAVYRSLYLLSKLYNLTGNTDLANKYKELCLRSNHKYPVNII